MKSRKMLHRVFARSVTVAFALGLSFGLLAAPAQAESVSEAAQKLLDYDAKGAKPSKVYRIAYLTECGQNPYCTARRAGLQAAADKYGF